MGRRIYEDGNFVWKYAFGYQPSEQHRIYDEFSIGELEFDEEYPDCDYLTLNIKDIPALQNIINNMENFEEAKAINKDFWDKYNGCAPFDIVDKMHEEVNNMCPNLYFGMMIEKMIKYMNESHEEDKEKTEFYFEGEL